MSKNLESEQRTKARENTMALEQLDAELNQEQAARELAIHNGDLLEITCNHLNIDGPLAFRVDNFADFLRIRGGSEKQTAELKDRLQDLGILDGLSPSIVYPRNDSQEAWLQLKGRTRFEGRERLESEGFSIVLLEALKVVVDKKTTAMIAALQVAKQRLVEFAEQPSQRPPLTASTKTGCTPELS